MQTSLSNRTHEPFDSEKTQQSIHNINKSKNTHKSHLDSGLKHDLNQETKHLHWEAFCELYLEVSFPLPLRPKSLATST
jgi:hypothetical protein